MGEVPGILPGMSWSGAGQNQSGIAVRAPSLKGLDPAKATTPEEFARVVSQLVARADVSFDDIVSFAVKDGRTLSKSSLSSYLNGKVLFPRNALWIVLEACSLPESECMRWDDAWAQIAQCKALGGSSPAQQQIDQLKGEIAEVSLRAREQAEKEARLQQALTSAEDEKSRLEREITRLRQQATQAHGWAATLQRQIDEQAANYERELAVVNQNIVGLRSQLKKAAKEQKEAEAEHERRLRAIQEDLAAESASIKSQLNLLHERAELERQAREMAEQAKHELEQLLADYQAQAHKQPLANQLKPVHQAPALRNEDIYTELRLKVSDWGGEHRVALDYEWYCIACEQGGVRYYDICPSCGHPTKRNYAKTRVVRLPAKPCYGETIRFKHMGNQDEAGLPAGHVYAKAIRIRG